MNRDDDDLGSPHDEDMDIRLHTSNELDLNIEHDGCIPEGIHVIPSSLSSKEEANTDGVLKIGTEFESDEHAHRFYNRYARLLGFSVRKDWVNRSKIHGQVVSRKFTCSREGYRRKDKRDINVKKHRKETRTGCLAHMIITRQPNGKYRVTHFEANHNHDNIKPNNAQTLQLQKELCVDQVAEVDLPNNLDTQSSMDYELSRRFEIRDSLDYLVMDYDYYLQSERGRDMKQGEAGRLLRHFQRQHFENPSFFYAVQLDIGDKVCNIFWADDNMVADYEHFGDVVCLDTTHRTNRDFLPFVQFIGVNHHNQVVIFAAAFLFDDTAESLKWLLHTFIEAMSGKKPKIILTDQDAAVVEAVNSVLSETDHRICLWQMYQNALKHLSHLVKDTEAFASEFRNCIYDQKDEEGFIQAWEALLENYGLRQNDWLKWMFREREKWAVVYGRNSFFLDLKCSHLVESLSNNLKSYLSSDQDLLLFFKHFERVVDEQRYKETKANDEMCRCMPRLMANVILLKHASEFYTLKAFEVFQREYEKCLNVVVNQSSEKGSLSEYKVNTFGQSGEYCVTYNSSDNTVACDCMKFEYVGFLCSHALKVLDHRNIKVVPSRYILKRWTRDARIGSVMDNSEFIESENLKLIAARRYKDLCCRILNISARAADSEEAFQFASRQLEEVIEGVEKILTLKTEAQGITLSSTGVNVSESENAEIFLDRNSIEDHEVDDRVEGTREKESPFHDRLKLKNINGRSSKTKRIQNVQAQSPNTVTCISSPTSAYVSPQAPTNNPAIQSVYNFEGNQVVQCMYQQPNLLVDEQPSTDMYQQPNFYSDQHDSPNQTQLLQEPLIRSTYHESVSNGTQLRQQAMDLDMHHPHSSSFLLYDHRYRAPDSSYLVPK